MKTKLMIALLALAAPLAVHSQDNLNWGSSTPIQDVYSGTLQSGGSASSGSLVQLLTFAGGSGPRNSPDVSLANGVNTANGNTLLDWTYVNFGSGNPGEFVKDNTFANYGINAGNTIWVRLWDGPSDGGTGDLPAPKNFSGFGYGWMYFDAPTSFVYLLPNAASQYTYDLNSIGKPTAGDWTFIAGVPPVVPEPTTFGFLLIGGAMMWIRRLRRS